MRSDEKRDHGFITPLVRRRVLSLVWPRKRNRSRCVVSTPFWWEPLTALLFFLAVHELLVPALKLSSNPLKEPVPDQIAEFTSHLIYVIGTAWTYDGIKSLG